MGMAVKVRSRMSARKFGVVIVLVVEADVLRKPGSQPARSEAAMSDIVLEVRNATKRFGPVLALNDISLAARRGGAGAPVRAGQCRLFEPQGIHQPQHIDCQRRLLTIAQGPGVPKPGRAKAALVGHDHSKPGAGELRRDLRIGVDVIGPAVEGDHGWPVGGAELGVTDAEFARVDLLEVISQRRHVAPGH